MKVAGIDLAGSENNTTGFCVLSSNGEKKIKTILLKSDIDILLQVDLINPDLIAIDAPLSEARNGFMRACDEELREYGTLPLSLRGMRCLVERGIRLANALRPTYKIVEVFPSATAKILGFYSKDDIQYQKNLLGLGLGGELSSRILNRDELDAITAALTAYLHMQGKTSEVGGDDGKIVVPKV